MNTDNEVVCDSNVKKERSSSEKDVKTHLETDQMSKSENEPLTTLESDLSKLTVESDSRQNSGNERKSEEQTTEDKPTKEFKAKKSTKGKKTAKIKGKEDMPTETILDQPRKTDEEVDSKPPFQTKPGNKIESELSETDPRKNPERNISHGMNPEQAGSALPDAKVTDLPAAKSKSEQAQTKTACDPEEWRTIGQKWFIKTHATYHSKEVSLHQPKFVEDTEATELKDPLVPAPPKTDPEPSSTPTHKRANRKKKSWKKKPAPTSESPELSLEDTTPRLPNDRVPPLPQDIYQRTDYEFPDPIETSPPIDQSVRPKTRNKKSKKKRKQQESSGACGQAMPDRPAEIDEILSQRTITVIVERDLRCPVYIFAADLVKFVTRCYSGEAGKNWEHKREFRPTASNPHFNMAVVAAVRSVCDDRASLMPVVFKRSFPNECLNETHFRIVAEPLRLAVTENIIITVIMLMEYLSFVAQFGAVAYDNKVRNGPYVALDLIYWSLVEFIGTRCMKDIDYLWSMVPLACRVLDKNSGNRHCKPGDELFGFLSLTVNSKGEQIQKAINKLRQ